MSNRLQHNGATTVFAVAPMMDWTDRHCRFFHRQLSGHALLYTEMVVADAILHGDRDRLLGGDETDGAVALQLGGSDPGKLSAAVLAAEPYGYSEYNLNVGCPSDRVQSGTFGACLMREPELVAKCVAAMKEKTSKLVSVKCRLGVDEQDTGPALDNLAQSVWGTGADSLWIHARKAWLEGLSPKENRDVPPLDYSRVHRLKRENPNRFIGLNGGLKSLNQALEVVREPVCLDGVMIGRAAYQTPMMLKDVDKLFSPCCEFSTDSQDADLDVVIERMCDYAERHLTSGGRLHHITRHMVGLFQGVRGAKRWRQALSTEAVLPGAGPEILYRAYQAIEKGASLEREAA